MGIVYCARDVRLGRRVALKALSPVHEANVRLRERLRREARAAATIAHPSVATIYALEEIDGHLFIASEFVEGHTLRTEIERGPLDPRRAVAIAIDIARALCAAHEVGVVHRDLKPENVLIATGGAVKVVDFGIAQVESLNTRLTRPGDAVGTPAYMPPEQLLGGEADARADIYALGVVLSEMLTGQHPLAPGRRAMPASASEIAWRCMQMDPKDRYQTAREVLEALERERQHPHYLRAQASVADASARWWWEFHQSAVAIVYAVMVWPTWIARTVIGGREGGCICGLRRASIRPSWRGRAAAPWAGCSGPMRSLRRRWSWGAVSSATCGLALPCSRSPSASPRHPHLPSSSPPPREPPSAPQAACSFFTPA